MPEDDDPSPLARALARRLLLHVVQDLSMKYLERGPYPGVEFALWRAVVETPDKISDDEATDLDRLSYIADGWWTFPELDPEFVDMEIWRERYARSLKETL